MSSESTTEISSWRFCNAESLSLIQRLWITIVLDCDLWKCKTDQVSSSSFTYVLCEPLTWFHLGHYLRQKDIKLSNFAQKLSIREKPGVFVLFLSYFVAWYLPGTWRRNWTCSSDALWNHLFRFESQITSPAANISSFVVWLYSSQCFCPKWQNQFVVSIFCRNNFLGYFTKYCV